MRSFGPVPLSLARSTPSSRAKARTEGEAYPALNASGSTGAAASGRASLASPRAGCCAGEGCGVLVGAAASGFSSAFVAAPAASSVRITLPSLTLSPTLTLSSLTTPADGAGTSMVALSDSSVTRASSGLTESPGLTKISITGTSLNSPMSGTLTVVTLPAPVDGPDTRDSTDLIGATSDGLPRAG